MPDEQAATVALHIPEPVAPSPRNTHPVRGSLRLDPSVSSPQITAGTTIITTRPDSLQDKSTVAYSPAGAGGGGAAKGAQSPRADSP